MIADVRSQRPSRQLNRSSASAEVASQPVHAGRVRWFSLQLRVLRLGLLQDGDVDRRPDVSMISEQTQRLTRLSAFVAAVAVAMHCRSAYARWAAFSNTIPRPRPSAYASSGANSCGDGRSRPSPSLSQSGCTANPSTPRQEPSARKQHGKVHLGNVPVLSSFGLACAVAEHVENAEKDASTGVGEAVRPCDHRRPCAMILCLTHSEESRQTAGQ